MLATKCEGLKKIMDETTKATQIFDVFQFLLELAKERIQEQQQQAKQKEFITKLPRA
jgi:hypothetical protein